MSKVSARSARVELIKAIQERRESNLVVYVTGDRSGASAQIGHDAIRPMYDHLRLLGFEKVPRIDLFLYSPGGGVDVPWRLVTMLRECGEELNVLVPYKAHSAATLIAVGADTIVMGKKGELGPIDPALTRTQQGEQTSVQESIRVEDVMAYVSFLKERVGINDIATLGGDVRILAERLGPWLLGSIYRTHSHIRTIARNLLMAHRQPLSEEKITRIVEVLAEKIYSHGHAIGRREATEIGLPVQMADHALDGQMWELWEAYEAMMKINDPIDPATAIPANFDSHEEPVVMACIESEKRFDVFRGRLRFRHVRQVPPQLNLNFNVQLQLPAGLDPEQLTPNAQQVLQQLLQQAQANIPRIVQAELQKNMPIQGTEGRLLGASWQTATDEGL